MAEMNFQDFVSPLPHPGEILREDFMEPLSLTAGALARAMGLKDRTRVERLSREKQPVTADTAARLARVFGNSAQFWMNLQAQHDLSRVEMERREELATLKPIVQPSHA
jgi:addiction module HigA family antidote